MKGERTMSDSRYFTETDDVAKTLKEYAANHKTSLNRIDFDLVEYETQYKNADVQEWESVTGETENRLRDREFLLDPQLQLRQMYQIAIYKRSKPRKPLPVKIGANKTKTKVVAVVEKKVKLHYSKKLQTAIEESIQKQMLINGYLIGIWELKSHLREFFDVLEEAGTMAFAQRQYLPVSSAIPPVETVDGKLEYLYREDFSDEDIFGRKDYKKRGFAFGVKEGEPIIRYIKPKAGKNGRDCKGTFIQVPEPKEGELPDFNISDDIKREESEEAISFIAKKSGFVALEENNTFDIKRYMEVESIDFKATGDINVGIDKDVHLIVNGLDDMKDSVGQGIEVVAKEINIKQGTVGSGAVLHADKLNIAGITHQNSKVYGDDVTINVHNGFAAGKTVYVKRLEGGVIEGETVVVEQAVGGEIKGQKIKIEALTSNSLIYASNVIEVTELKGEDNIFTIDPFLVKGLREQIEELTKEKNRYEIARDDIREELQKKRKILKGSEAVAKQIRQRIQEDKEKDVKTPASYLEKIRKLKALIKSVRLLDEEVMLLNEEIERCQTELDIKQSIVFNAKVINKKDWKGYNTVAFSLITPEVVKETTTEGKKNVIMIKDTGDGEYTIESKDLEELERETEASEKKE